jgi:hypothetical protein
MDKPLRPLDGGARSNTLQIKGVMSSGYPGKRAYVRINAAAWGPGQLDNRTDTG